MQCGTAPATVWVFYSTVETPRDGASIAEQDIGPWGNQTTLRSAQVTLMFINAAPTQDRSWGSLLEFRSDNLRVCWTKADVQLLEVLSVTGVKANFSPAKINLTIGAPLEDNCFSVFVQIPQALTICPDIAAPSRCLPSIPSEMKFTVNVVLSTDVSAVRANGWYNVSTNSYEIKTKTNSVAEWIGNNDRQYYGLSRPTVQTLDNRFRVVLSGPYSLDMAASRKRTFPPSDAGGKPIGMRAVSQFELLARNP